MYAYRVSGRIGSFALADLPRIHGVGGPVRVSVPGKSELMISVIGPIAPEPPEACIWAVLREAVP